MTPEQSPPGRRSEHTGRLKYGLPVSDVLRLSTLAGSRVVAGAGGLGRLVQRMNVMEVPDILPWVKDHEFLLTTGYPLKNTPQPLDQLIRELNDRRLAALAVKTGRYLDDLPAELLAQADRLDFPVIHLSHDVAFDDILNQVLTDILNHHASLLVRNDELHRSLVQIVLEGGGLGELAMEVHQHLGGHALLTAPDGAVIAASGPMTMLARTLPDGVLVDGSLSLPRMTGSVMGAEAAPATALVPIIASGADHGRIAWFLPGHTPTLSDVHALERAATVAALFITRMLALTAVEAKYSGDFLRDVLEGRAGERARIVDRAAVLGWDLDRPLVALVAELEETEPQHETARRRQVYERFASAWARALQAHDRHAAFAGFSQQVVVLAGAATDEDARCLAEKLSAAVDTALNPSVHGGASRHVAETTEGAGGGRQFSVGVSRVVTRVEDVTEAYGQAGKALRVGRRIRGQAAWIHFDDLGVFRLLSLIPDQVELSTFVRDTLGPLSEERGQDLIPTLEVLLEANGNVAEASRRLHYHYNTLRYRITKLEEALGPFMNDPCKRLALELALQVLRMRDQLSPVS